MTSYKVMVSIPEYQKVFLREHKEISRSGLFQKAVDEEIEKEKKLEQKERA